MLSVVELVLQAREDVGLATVGAKASVAFLAAGLFGFDGGGVKGGEGEELVVAAAKERVHVGFFENEGLVEGFFVGWDF